MSDKKNLRIGVTINLENYENLRVEIEGGVSGDSDPDELINYLDNVLEKFGNNDPDTKKRVESYRRRVIHQKPKVSLRTDKSGETEEVEESALPEKSGSREKEVENPVIELQKDRDNPKESDDENKGEKTSELPSDMNLRSEIRVKSGKRKACPDRVSDIPEGIIHYNGNNKIINKTTLCEICGSAVTPQAEHASRVIAGKILCRKCLDSIKR